MKHSAPDFRRGRRRLIDILSEAASRAAVRETGEASDEEGGVLGNTETDWRRFPGHFGSCRGRGAWRQRCAGGPQLASPYKGAISRGRPGILAR